MALKGSEGSEDLFLILCVKLKSALALIHPMQGVSDAVLDSIERSIYFRQQCPPAVDVSRVICATTARGCPTSNQLSCTPRIFIKVAAVMKRLFDS
jgi:hypothetical protein